jgi:hypothetical protein
MGAKKLIRFIREIVWAIQVPPTERHSAAEPQPMLEFTLQRAAGHTLKRELQQNHCALQRN